LSDETPAPPTTDNVATAHEKFHCPACGGEANWNPAKQALVCPFCGTESPATLQTRSADTVIAEYDLVEALRNVPDAARGCSTVFDRAREGGHLCDAVFVPRPSLGRLDDEGAAVKSFLRRALLVGSVTALTLVVPGHVGSPNVVFDGAAGPYPVRVIVPYSPGGSSDAVARIVAQKLGEMLGQQFVIDNRPGASGSLGREIVAKASPDGYTLLIGDSPHIINVHVLRHVPYDPIKDFTPISLLATAPQVLVINPTSPAQTLSDFIAAARAQGDRIAQRLGRRDAVLPVPARGAGQHIRGARRQREIEHVGGFRVQRRIAPQPHAGGTQQAHADDALERRHVAMPAEWRARRVLGDQHVREA